MPTRTVDHWEKQADGSYVKTTTTYEASDEQVNLETILNAARTALTANKTYLGLASPTNAQNLAQIRALTRQVNALIRVLLQDFTGTD